MDRQTSASFVLKKLICDRYHKQFIHGISSVTGESFAPPSDIRIVWYLSPSTLPVPLSTATAGAKSPVDSYSPKTCQLCLIAEGHCAVCGDYIALQTSKKRSQILGMSLNDAQTILIGVNGQATLIPDLDGDTDCNDGTIRLLAHAKENGSILVPFPPDSAYSIQSHLGDVEQALKVRGQTMHWFRHAHKCHQPPLVEAKKKHGKKTARARSVSGPDLKAFPSTSSKSDSAVGKRRSSRRKTANKEHSTLSSVPVPVVSAPLDTVLETPIEENPPSAVREEGVSKMMDPPANSQMLPSHDVRRCLSEQNVAHESSTSIQHDTSKLDFTGLLNQGALPPPTNGGPSLLSVQLAPHYQADHVRRATIDVPVDYRFARHPYPPPSMGHSASYDPSVRPVPVSYMDQGSNFSYTHAVPEGLYSHVPYSNQYQGTDMPVLMTHSHTGSSASLSSGSSTATSSSGMNPRQRSQSAFDVPTSAFVSYSVPPVMLPPAFFMQRNDSKYGLQKPVRSMSMDMQPRPEPWMTQPSHSMGQFGGGLVGSSSIKCTGSTPPPLTLFSMYPPHPSSHERSHSMGLSTDMSNKLSLASGGNDQTLHGEWWQRDVSRGVVPGEYQPDGNHAS